jgi:hypothetical protein
MPSSEAPRQRTQALALLRRRGPARLAELREASITAVTMSRMARGLYHLTDAACPSVNW